MKKIIVTAGGTAGHLFPAITLGDELIKRGYELHLITDPRCKKYLTTDLKLIYHVINVKLFPPGLLNKLKLFILLFYITSKLILLLIKIKPSVIIGFGGYPTFAPLLAAVLLRIPIIVYEQNGFIGKTNRFFLRYAKQVALTYQQTKGYEREGYEREGSEKIDKEKTIIIGNIIREDIKKLRVKDDFNHDPFRIFIFGGSQGAKIFASLIPASIKILAKLSPNIHITQQAALEDHANIAAIYDSLKISYQLADFFYDMDNQYQNHELVIARSGASTIAELSYVGLPAIFIPLPTAADNHQFYNAKALEDRGAGWCYQQKDISPQKLAEKLLVLMKNRDILKQASDKLLKSRNDGSHLLANMVENIIGKVSS